MIYLFHGADRNAILKASDSLIKKFFAKNPNLSYEKFDEDSLDISALRALAGTPSLFGGTSLVIIDNGTMNEEFEDVLPALGASEHTFMLREGALLKGVLKSFEKHAKEIKGFETKEGKKEAFNVFAFTDALGERNKKNAWILFQKALASGLVSEELFWKAVWQIKTLLLAEKTGSADEAGLNPYVYRKAKGNLMKWKKGELENFSERLVKGYHDARRGGEEVGSLLEKELLRL